jgi:hypothetical protein
MKDATREKLLVLVDQLRNADMEITLLAQGASVTPAEAAAMQTAGELVVQAARQLNKALES